MAVDPLQPIARLNPAAGAYEAGPGASGFARLLDQVLGAPAAAEAQAAQAVQDLATGQAEDVHTAALAMAQADLSFRLALELRNRLQEAYQQVTQLQV